MVDLETLGNKPGAVIVSISAVQFDLVTGETGKKFSTFISLEDSIKQGLQMDASTVVWWLNQAKEAQEMLVDGIAHGEHVTLQTALMDFNSFIINTFGNKSDVEVWGNSARFDFGLLCRAYDLAGIKYGWSHRNERCVRTLVSFCPEIKKGTKFEGVAHDGLYDCLHQIKYCSETYNAVMQESYEEETRQ